MLINNDGFRNRFHAVCVDDYLDAYEGTLYLIQNGHRNIGYLEYNRPDMPSIMINRLHNHPDDVHVLNVKQQPVERGSCKSIAGS